MSYDLYLSYSGRKCYEKCPRQYKFRYVDKDPARKDPKDTLFGSAIGKIFEWFYEERLWAMPDPVAASVAQIPRAVDLIFRQEKLEPDYRPDVKQSLFDDLYRSVPSGVEIIRNGGFLTKLSQAEVDLTVTYGPDAGPTVKIGGRADFIHGEDRLDLWILDGKASKKREKYVDKEQLIWYAVQHYLKFHVAPKRLGFIFWSFPDAPVMWIQYSSDDMRNSLKHTLEVSRFILDGKFDATPSGECHGCPYRPKCDDGCIYLAKRKVETGGRIDQSIFDLEGP